MERDGLAAAQRAELKMLEEEHDDEGELPAHDTQDENVFDLKELEKKTGEVSLRMPESDRVALWICSAVGGAKSST